MEKQDHEKTKDLFERVFNRRVIIVTALISFILTIIIVLIFGTLAEGATVPPRLLYLDQGVTENILLQLALIIIIIIVMGIAAIILFIDAKSINQIQKKKASPSVLRDMLFITTIILGVGLLFEIPYILYDSDYNGWNVIGQFYSFLDTFAMVIFIAIAFTIFLAEASTRNPKITLIGFIFSIICLITVFIMEILYGLYPVEFDIGIYVAFGVIFLLIIEAVIIIFKIASIYKRISENKAALGFIALQLALLVASIVLLVGCALTHQIVYDPTNFLPNRILRLIRALVFLIIAISYYPAFIIPARKSA